VQGLGVVDVVVSVVGFAAVVMVVRIFVEQMRSLVMLLWSWTLTRPCSAVHSSTS